MRFWRTRQPSSEGTTIDEARFQEALQTAFAGEETVLGITIDRESWKKAPSGSYADTVTFQISYVDATD